MEAARQAEILLLTANLGLDAVQGTLKSPDDEWRSILLYVEDEEATRLAVHEIHFDRGFEHTINEIRKQITDAGVVAFVLIMSADIKLVKDNQDPMTVDPDTLEVIGESIVIHQVYTDKNTLESTHNVFTRAVNRHDDMPPTLEDPVGREDLEGSLLGTLQEPVFHNAVQQYTH